MHDTSTQDGGSESEGKSEDGVDPAFCCMRRGRSHKCKRSRCFERDCKCHDWSVVKMREGLADCHMVEAA